MSAATSVRNVGVPADPLGAANTVLAVCDAKVGTEVWMISKAVTPVVVSQELKLDYFYANSRGPDGVVQSERWTILD
jgi:hypothetical protein